ncbi:MAG: disulfide oxidoreductase, partial [Oribacterium sp.]|nr:disulfide oxidoreductase [Oribacterium sp.]
MLIGDLLQMNDMIAPFLMQNGMGCIYCPASMGES